jgi:hypothetical protein
MSTHPIKLTFVNQSNDTGNNHVVIFQKNVATNFDELAIAWKVIKNCGRGWSHPFTYTHEFSVGASDSYGNQIMGNFPVNYGDTIGVFDGNSGETIRKMSHSASSMNEIEMINQRLSGSINSLIYRDGKLLAMKTAVSPRDKAVFQFKPTLYIGAVSQIEEGQVMNAAILSDINTEISLLGVQSADILMTGGSQGTPFQFELANVMHEV